MIGRHTGERANQKTLLFRALLAAVRPIPHRRDPRARGVHTAKYIKEWTKVPPAAEPGHASRRAGREASQVSFVASLDGE